MAWFHLFCCVQYWLFCRKREFPADIAGNNRHALGPMFPSLPLMKKQQVPQVRINNTVGSNTGL